MYTYYKAKYARRKGGTANFFLIIATFFLCICLFIGIFWWNGQSTETVSLPQSYYFVIRECESTTASAVAGEVYLSGGAGYLYEANGKSNVVLACYFSETAAQSVCRTLEEKGTEASVMALKPQEFVLRGGRADYAAQIAANASTLDSCVRLLYDTANGLERAECSQDEARAAVRGVTEVLSGLRGQNADGMFERWNAALRAAEKKGIEIAEGILFAKDIRYLQVQVCFSVVQAKEYF